MNSPSMKSDKKLPNLLLRYQSMIARRIKMVAIKRSDTRGVFVQLFKIMMIYSDIAKIIVRQSNRALCNSSLYGFHDLTFYLLIHMSLCKLPLSVEA